MNLLSILNMIYFNVLGGTFDSLNPMNWETIKISLDVLWKGLLAIFVVIIIIIVIVKLIQWAIVKITTPPKDEN